MSDIRINGQRHPLQDKQTLEGLLERVGYGGESFAVAVNGEFVPRADYANKEIKPGDRLDVVAPVVGG